MSTIIGSKVALMGPVLTTRASISITKELSAVRNPLVVATWSTYSGSCWLILISPTSSLEKLRMACTIASMVVDFGAFVLKAEGYDGTLRFLS
jgi:hypothetical protein